MTHSKFAYTVTHDSYLCTWGNKYYFGYGGGIGKLKFKCEMVNCSKFKQKCCVVFG